MPFENSAGIGVNNFYGARDTGGTVGVEQSTDSVHQLSIAMTGESLQSSFLPPFVVPRVLNSCELCFVWMKHSP